jgi:hypothetical protein
MREKQETRETSVEALLAHHLGPVAAPEELWRRIQHGSPSERPRPTLRATWVIATVLSLAALTWGVCFDAKSNNNSVANGTVLQALAGGPENLEFRSHEALQIREWVKERTGLNIPLPVQCSAKVQLVGASVIKGAAPAAAVGYRVNHHYAMLLVSESAPPPQRGMGHYSLANERVKNAQITSWTMRGQSYALAYAAMGELHDACGVCHVDSERLTALN